MLTNTSFTDGFLVEPYYINLEYMCFITSPGVFIFSIFNVTCILLLLPICTVIVYFGFQQLQQKNHTSSLISHCDSFTYHMVGMELIGILGCMTCFCASCTDNMTILNIGITIFSFTWYGQIFFHVLTCVERYLAVVHPITYLSLRKEKGIRIRNITIGCIWLLCLIGVTVMATETYMYLDFSLLISSTVIISFCSLSVLCVLIHSGQKKQGMSRERVDQSKQRAFYTILVILGILLLRLTFGLVWAGFELTGNRLRCMMMVCGIWVNLPSSLVLPLLFIQRKGKLVCC